MVIFGQVLDCIDRHGNDYPTFVVVPLEIDAAVEIATKSSTILYVSVRITEKRCLRFLSPIYLTPKLLMHRLNQMGQEMYFQRLGMCCTSK
jgi:hypothetical protein